MKYDLINVVINNSVSDFWDNAVTEWDISYYEEDEDCSSKCICGKENIKYLFTIRNRLNGNELFPIGSRCIKRFGLRDLYYETECIQGMYKLYHAIQNNERITLDSNFFSRKLLKYLFEKGAFKPTVYNRNMPVYDYRFMLDMFNARYISNSQQSKINAIIAFQIKPFLQNTLKFHNNDSN